MDKILNITFFVSFLGMLIISSKIMLDINFEKIFKQGKIGSIRAFFFITIFIISSLAAICMKELVEVFYSILNF